MTIIPPSPFLEFVASPGTTDRPAAALTPPVGAVAGTRFELDEEKFLAALMSEVELMPVFLDNPSWDYLEAVRA